MRELTPEEMGKVGGAFAVPEVQLHLTGLGPLVPLAPLLGPEDEPGHGTLPEPDPEPDPLPEFPNLVLVADAQLPASTERISGMPATTAAEEIQPSFGYDTEVDPVDNKADGEQQSANPAPEGIDQETWNLAVKYKDEIIGERGTLADLESEIRKHSGTEQNAVRVAEIDAEIAKLAVQYNIPEGALRALIFTESSYLQFTRYGDTIATRSPADSSATGLGQVLGPTADLYEFDYERMQVDWRYNLGSAAHIYNAGYDHKWVNDLADEFNMGYRDLVLTDEEGEVLDEIILFRKAFYAYHVYHDGFSDPLATDDPTTERDERHLISYQEFRDKIYSPVEREKVERMLEWYPVYEPFNPRAVQIMQDLDFRGIMLNYYSDPSAFHNMAETYNDQLGGGIFPQFESLFQLEPLVPRGW